MIGQKYNNLPCGIFGDISTFSFYANKHITTGEGGIALFRNKEIYEKAKLLRDHGMSKTKRYWQELVGFNYRMSEIHAAIGCEQIKKINSFLNIRKKNFNHLKKLFSKSKNLKVIDTKDIYKINSHYCLMLLLPNQNQKKR